MNPFTWPGPKFMVAYIMLALVVLAILAYQWFRSGSGGRTPKVNDLTGDPYRIAYLRGGAQEAVKVAVFNLIDRGILRFDDNAVRALRPEAVDALRRPLDRAIVRSCPNGAAIATLMRAPSVLKAAEEYATELGKYGLCSDGEEYAFRRSVGWAAIGLLGGVALVKIVYALSRGYGNVFFLIIAAIVSTAAASWIVRQRKTYAGLQMVESVRTLLKRLRDNSDRIKPGGETNEALLLASAFGIYALSSVLFPFVGQMFPRPKPGTSSGDSDDSDSCSSSSCSSSNSSCSSSSCGGGGGCGGCGS